MTVVGIYSTCLVDLFRPSVTRAARILLNAANCEVIIPPRQTCCGQPAYNSGDRFGARQAMLDLMRDYAVCDAVVVPSGSCAGMIRAHGPKLFDPGTVEREKADNLAGKCYELTQYLHDVCGLDSLAPIKDTGTLRVTYHDSCSGLRELGIREQPRRLLAHMTGGSATLIEGKDAEQCCGFGGAFCMKYPEISNRMTTEKTADITASDVDCVLAGDMGCLLCIAGKLLRDGSRVDARHIAEVLAGLDDEIPAIGR